jgi:tetratricopeptide (TPR) repeat protein
LVEKTHGRIIWINKIGNFPEWNCGWYGIHIVKSNEGNPLLQNCSLDNKHNMARFFNEDGVDLLNAGDIDGAQAAFLRSIEQCSEFAIAHNNLGLLSCQQGQYKNAVRHFAKALELAPSNLAIVENIAIASKKLELVR